MEKKEGAGSVWNVNSWHWQMKNYSEISKQILQQKILTLTFHPSPDFAIHHTKVKFNTAEAQVNIRKGKQILMYEFDMELTVNGQHESEDDSEGSYRVKQILNDDLNDMVIDDVKATEKNKVADQLKKWLKKNAKPEIIKIFQQYEKQLMNMEGDPQKLQADRKRRQQLIQATKEAHEKKGAEKQKLLEQQKAKETKMKQQAYEKMCKK